ncbi:hypothetical protein WJX74_004512 [Apatococcus lobatus]|uniref:ABC transporter domain-containing protein n=1 Tax=Apatococcus lobatus TaxID=904363 RepID=A0AAW1QIG5_9CHLO
MSRTDDAGAVEVVVQEDLSRDKLASIAHHKSSKQLGDSPDLVVQNMEETPVELIPAIPEQQRLFLEYHDVCAWVSTSFGPPSLLSKATGLVTGLFQKGSKESKPTHRQILYNITGCCRPGEVLALMGPSGSGKTTLLTIMGARAQSHMRKEGDVNFNGQALNKRLKRQLGFVLQDDLLYESLTVWETLYYAAMLRMPREMSTAEKKSRVETVIKALGIESTRNTIIGGFFRKGISGGERKRVSIGHELLINPAVLLLDEPTSGLDSTTAMRLLTTLRQLAQGGRAIIPTIHQPSSRLFQQLDKLLLLSKGHCLYYGMSDQVDTWFDHLGYTLPYKINIADFILDLASADVTKINRDGEQSRQFLIKCSEAYMQRHPTNGFKNVDPDLMTLKDAADALPIKASAGQEPVLSVPWGKTQTESRRALEVIIDNTGRGGPASSRPSDDGGFMQRWLPFIPIGQPKGPSRWGAPYHTQLRILFIRSVRTRRFESLSTQDFAQFIVIGLLAGCFWYQRAKPDTLSAAGDTLGLLFFQLMFMSFRTLFVALFTFPNEFKMLLKERASGMYRLSAFYFARTASDLPMDFAVPTVFLLIVYWMTGLRPTAQAFFENYFTVMFLSLVAQSFGLLLGTILMNPKTAQTIAAILMLAFVLTGGYFVRGIPVWISWIKYLSFVYYGYGLLVHIEFSRRTLYSCLGSTGGVGSGAGLGSGQLSVSNPQTDPACTPIASLQTALGLQQDPNSMHYQAINASVLVAFLIFLRFCVYVALRKKTARV